MSYGDYYNMYDAINAHNDAKSTRQNERSNYSSGLTRGPRSYGLGTDSYDDSDDDYDN